MSNWKRLSLALAVTIAIAVPSFAQTDRATLEGTVTDSSGATISGARVKKPLMFLTMSSLVISENSALFMRRASMPWATPFFYAARQRLWSNHFYRERAGYEQRYRLAAPIAIHDAA
jgi:hypothetical protein